MTKAHDVAALGQSIWLDFIRRSFTDTGELQILLDRGVRGVTSNPSIFEKAIAGSSDYDDDLRRLVGEGKSVVEIYETLALDDIQKAADLLLPLYNESDGGDGFVSLEVSPTLANDTAGTILDAERLYMATNRSNVMIKIPATPAGIPAIEAVIGAGINVNVTLIFGLSQYEAAAEAYIGGLERLASARGDVSKVASVASFFVSRVDTAVDAALEQAGNTALQGKVAVDNARLAYARFEEIFGGARWEALAKLGARVQRPLWASTGTKNPAYSDTLYVDSLIGADTVNTIPPETLEAFLDHGKPAVAIGNDLSGAHSRLGELAALGIDLARISQTLLEDGVTAFAKSFETLLASIRSKCQQLRG